MRIHTFKKNFSNKYSDSFSYFSNYRIFKINKIKVKILEIKKIFILIINNLIQFIIYNFIFVFLMILYLIKIIFLI